MFTIFHLLLNFSASFGLEKGIRRFILHSAVKISDGSPCLHLQPDISGMFSRMEDESKFLNIVLETGLISWTIRHDDLSHLSDMFCSFDLEREEILYNYL